MPSSNRSRNRANSLALATGLVFSIPLMSHADNVIATNLIVQGSTAIGLDSVNGESFGYDTLRLKENNVRINFDDTSASAGFPANDWRLLANDGLSTAGGANYFAIEDSTAGKVPFRIDAGTPANTLRTTSAGNVGIGLADPALDLHIQATDTPAIRLEQTNGGGFTAQTWDVAGNEASFFIRDLTGGSKLCFRIRPGAPSSSIDVAGSGNVGIGTASPSAKLHVAGNALVTGTLEIGSSRTLKEDIRDLSLDEAQEAFAALKPVHFKYKTDAEQQLGFIAEDVPDLVATNSRKSLVPMDFIAVLTKVVQQQDNRVQELEKKLSARDEALEALTLRLNALEQGATAHMTSSAMTEEMTQTSHAPRRDPVDSPAPTPPTASQPLQETAAQVINNGR